MNKPTGKLAMAYRTISNMESKIAELVAASQASLELVGIVTAERDVLAAQLASLNKLHSDLTNADMVLEDGEHSGYMITSGQLEDMEHYLSEPIPCLAAHDAEVKANAVIDFADHLVDIGQLRSAYPAEEYAAQLRAKDQQ